MKTQQIDDDINAILSAYDGMTIDEISNQLCVDALRSLMLDIHQRVWVHAFANARSTLLKSSKKDK